MKGLSDDHPTADDLIPSVRRSIDEARRFLVEKKIVTIPSEVRPRIEETPPYARSGSFASMDTPGPFESKATEAFYYVTPVEKDWDARHAEEHLRLYNPPVVAMINVHEAYPGHYLQFLYAPRFPTKTRKLVFCGTNAEGWAHYTEQMMVDEGFGGGDPKVRLAQLQEALLRDCRYVVGVKLHTRGMTVEEGARVFVEKVPGARQRLRGVAPRGLQPDLPLLHLRQAPDPGASRRVPGEEGRRAPRVPRRLRRPGRPADRDGPQDPLPLTSHRDIRRADSTGGGDGDRRGVARYSGPEWVARPGLLPRRAARLPSARGVAAASWGAWSWAGPGPPWGWRSWDRSACSRSCRS